MKNQDVYLSLVAELTNPPFQETRTLEHIIQSVQGLVKKYSTVLGKFIGVKEQNLREIGRLFKNKTMIFCFGNHEISVNLLFFQPAQRWEVKNVQLLAKS